MTARPRRSAASSRRHRLRTTGMAEPRSATSAEASPPAEETTATLPDHHTACLASCALSADVLGWARTAHYVTAVADDGDIQLRSEAGAPTRYYIRQRGPDRLELTQTADGDSEQPVLFVARVDVL